MKLIVFIAIFLLFGCLFMPGCRAPGVIGAGLMGASFRNYSDNKSNEARIEELENQLAALRNRSEGVVYTITSSQVTCHNQAHQEDELADGLFMKTCYWNNVPFYKGYRDCTVKILFVVTPGHPGVYIDEEVLIPGTQIAIPVSAAAPQDEENYPLF